MAVDRTVINFGVEHCYTHMHLQCTEHMHLQCTEHMHVRTDGTNVRTTTTQLGRNLTLSIVREKTAENA